MNKHQIIVELYNLPNIGKALAEKLLFAFIHSEFELKSLGAKEVFVKLLAFDRTACINQLYAIEGAIQGIRWHGIEYDVKQELLEFYHSVKQA